MGRISVAELELSVTTAWTLGVPRYTAHILNFTLPDRSLRLFKALAYLLPAEPVGSDRADQIEGNSSASADAALQ
jgi:hypothetical protein